MYHQQAGNDKRLIEEKNREICIRSLGDLRERELATDRSNLYFVGFADLSARNKDYKALDPGNAVSLGSKVFNLYFYGFTLGDRFVKLFLRVLAGIIESFIRGFSFKILLDFSFLIDLYFFFKIFLEIFVIFKLFFKIVVRHA